MTLSHKNAAFLRDHTLLIGLGAPRSGTSWLFNYLRGHEAVFTSSIKEMHFFSYYAPGKRWPRGKGAGALPPAASPLARIAGLPRGACG